MRWVNSELAWEAKALLLEAAQGALESGRLCTEVHCLHRSVIAFEVQTEDGGDWTVGFCGAHAVEVAADAPAGASFSRPRLVEPDEVMSGPAQADDD